MLRFVNRPRMAGLFVVAGFALASTDASLADSLAMQVGGLTNPPVGYIDFCRSFPDQCIAHGSEGAEPLTEVSWGELQDVNSSVNRSVAPVTDLQYYHRDE